MPISFESEPLRKEASFNELFENPEKHIGKEVVFSASVDQVIKQGLPWSLKQGQGCFTVLQPYLIDQGIESYFQEKIYVVANSDLIKHLAIVPYETVHLTGNLQLKGEILVFYASSIKKNDTNIKVETSDQRLRLAFSLFRRSHLKSAKEEFDDSYSQGVDERYKGQVSKYYGRTLSLLGDRRKAAETLKNSWDLRQEKEVAQWLAQVLIDSEKLGEAEELLKEAIESFPTEATLRSLLAKTYAHLGKFEQCLVYGRSALNIDPFSEETYFTMGRVLESQGQRDQVIQLYREAIERRPSNPGRYHLSLGQIYMDQKKYDFAVNEFELAKRYLPEKKETYLKTAQALRKRGKKFSQSAVINYKKALEMDPNLSSVRQELAETHYENQDYSDVIDLLAPILSDSKNRLKNLVLVGLSHERLGQFERAKVSFERAQAVESSPYHLLHLGYLEEELGNIQAAASHYGEAASGSLNEKYQAHALLKASTLFLSLEEGSRALEMARRAHQLDSNHLGVQINLGLCQEHMGLNREALRTFEQILSDPGIEYFEKVIASQNWLLNSLILGVKNMTQLIRAQFIYEAAPNQKTKLLYGWTLVRHKNKKGLKILKQVDRNKPEVYLAQLEGFLLNGEYARFQKETQNEIAFDNPHHNNLFRSLKKTFKNLN